MTINVTFLYPLSRENILDQSDILTCRLKNEFNIRKRILQFVKEWIHYDKGFILEMNGDSLSGNLPPEFIHDLL